MCRAGGAQCPSQTRLKGAGVAEWIELRPGRYIRRTPDGQWEGKQVGSVKRSIERNKMLQKASKDKPSLGDTGGALGRIVAAYPEDVEQEIHEKCGQDPDKRNAFLADNPQWLTTSRRNADIPPRKKYYYPGKTRKDR